MTVLRIYLGACCLSRLTDDQSQPRIREESEAIERIFVGVRRGTVELISSRALEDEVRRNPSIERRLEAEAFLTLAVSTIDIDEPLVRRAADLIWLGYSVFDALHIAAGETAEVDAMLSTDDGLIKRAARRVGKPRIPVRNPVSWIREHGL